jgi:hypothetical protein
MCFASSRHTAQNTRPGNDFFWFAGFIEGPLSSFLTFKNNPPGADSRLTDGLGKSGTTKAETWGKSTFGTDGIRGLVGKNQITPEFCLRLSWAIGKVFTQEGRRPQILIGKDTRISGYMLESVLQSGFVSAGADVSLLGPIPTPAIAYLPEH